MKGMLYGAVFDLWRLQRDSKNIISKAVLGL